MGVASEATYESIFCNWSHGLDFERECHTALRDICTITIKGGRYVAVEGQGLPNLRYYTLAQTDGNWEEWNRLSHH